MINSKMQSANRISVRQPYRYGSSQLHRSAQNNNLLNKENKITVWDREKLRKKIERRWRDYKAKSQSWRRQLKESGSPSPSGSASKAPPSSSPLESRSKFETQRIQFESVLDFFFPPFEL